LGGGDRGSGGEAVSTGAARVPPERHPNGGSKLAKRLRAAAADWEASGDAAALRRAQPSVLPRLEH